jgi:hypothetical protein
MTTVATQTDLRNDDIRSVKEDVCKLKQQIEECFKTLKILTDDVFYYKHPYMETRITENLESILQADEEAQDA